MPYLPGMAVCASTHFYYDESDIDRLRVALKREERRALLTAG
jgi:hypothetical protein